MKLNAKHGIFASAKASGGKPDASQLELINRFTLEEATDENIYVRTVYLAHNGIDRDRDVFDDALLAQFADSIVGKGVFVKHPMSYDGDTGPGVGRWFTARVLDVSLDEARQMLREPNLRFPPATERARILEAGFFLPRSDKNAALIQDIDYGAAGDVSIGFSASDRAPITDGESEEPIAWRIMGPGQALEGSLVWLGAQPGARVTKHHDLFDREDQDMKTVEELQAELKSVKQAHATEIQTKDNEITELKKLEPKAAERDALVKALGEGGEDLVKNPETIARAIAEQKAAHSKMIDDVIAAERVAGLIEKDDEESIKAAKAEYKDFSMERLGKLLETAKKRAPAGGGLGGSDPNYTGAKGEDTRNEGEKDYGNPADNPLLHGSKEPAGA